MCIPVKVKNPMRHREKKRENIVLQGCNTISNDNIIVINDNNSVITLTEEKLFFSFENNYSVCP